MIGLSEKGRTSGSIATTLSLFSPILLVLKRGHTPLVRCRCAHKRMVPTGDSLDENIWCHGRLLHCVQMSTVFDDAKTFVDMPSRQPGPEVGVEFVRQFGEEGEVPAEQLRDFLKKHFEEAGSDMPAINITPRPPVRAKFLSKLKHKDAVHLAKHIHNLWFELTREAGPEVETHPDRHTMVPLPRPFVIPGDRFREAYYWDTFWSIEGMLVTGLTGIAQGIVENFLHMVEKFGHVPNGNRVYYINRSQPPLLSQMVVAVHDVTKERAFLDKALPLLVREHTYWTTGPKVVRVRKAAVGTTPGAAAVGAVAVEAEEGVSGGDGGTDACHSLARYFADWQSPRPEAYTMDWEISLRVPADQRPAFHRNMSSNAESGWDFSTRWCSQPPPPGGGPMDLDLSTNRTTQLLPADLNGYMYQMERNIEHLATLAGQTDLAVAFGRAAEARKQAMRDVMWCEKDGQWHDVLLEEVQQQPDGSLDCSRHSQVLRCYVSNWVPLYCGLAEVDHAVGEAAARSLRDSGLVMVGGVSTSLIDSKQQWDLPNGWPNMQMMMIEGCHKYGGEIGRTLARDIAGRWVSNCWQAYLSTGDFWEKYDVTQVGGKGGGGEYVVQRGFGWTNGVLMQLLDMYGDELMEAEAGAGVEPTPGCGEVGGASKAAGGNGSGSKCIAS